MGKFYYEAKKQIFSIKNFALLNRENSNCNDLINITENRIG